MAHRFECEEASMYVQSDHRHHMEHPIERLAEKTSQHVYATHDTRESVEGPVPALTAGNEDPAPKS